MIFDPETYSPVWVEDFYLSAISTAAGSATPPRCLTHSSLGCLTDPAHRWRFEPGLGADFEISETLLLHCGFRLTFPNDQVYELLQPEPGIFIGRLPGRARPELFAIDRPTEEEGDDRFLNYGETEIGLHIKKPAGECQFALAVVQGDRQACRQALQSWAPGVGDLLPRHWDAQLAQRQSWCSRLPENFPAENAGLALERLQGLIERSDTLKPGLLIRDPADSGSHFRLSLALQVIPALALTQPALAGEWMTSLLELPRLISGGWAETYDLGNGVTATGGPAEPRIASVLAALPAEVLNGLDRPRLLSAVKAHIESFLASPRPPLPQWPDPETAFTPEVTDPDELRQFDLAAMLVLEIEACRKLSGESGWMEDLRKQLISEIHRDFWSDKRRRFLDKTLNGDFAARVTAATLIPLLWTQTDKGVRQALRQALRAGDELHHPRGIRQWQGRKDDPVPPPLRLSTQHLFLPLLGRLPPEDAALLSADWHRLLEADPTFSDPGAAALLLRLMPYAGQVNPHLERYPAWVRRLEKHRQVLVTVVAAILLLIPALFSIYFALRSDYNLQDEMLEAGHAQTLITMGNLEQAEEVYDRLLIYTREGGRQNQYFLNRGDLRFKQGNYEAALEDYQQAIALDPPGILYRARWNLAQTYARLGKRDQAIDAMRGFIDEYGEELPSYKQMGGNAISLWRK